MKKVVANTFTPYYDPIEDRIILVINYNDFNNRVEFMITRRFIINLFFSIDDIFTKFCNINEEKLEIKNSNNLNKNTDNSNLQLLKKTPSLLKEINFNKNHTNNTINIKFTSEEVEAIAEVNCQILKALFNNIKKAVPKIEWSIANL